MFKVSKKVNWHCFVKEEYGQLYSGLEETKEDIYSFNPESPNFHLKGYIMANIRFENELTEFEKYFFSIRRVTRLAKPETNVYRHVPLYIAAASFSLFVLWLIVGC